MPTFAQVQGRELWTAGVHGVGETFYTAGHTIRMDRIDADNGWATVTITPGHQEVHKILGQTVTLQDQGGMSLAAQDSAVCKSGAVHGADSFVAGEAAAQPATLYAATKLTTNAAWRVRDASHIAYGNVALELGAHPRHYISCGLASQKCDLFVGPVSLAQTFVPTQDGAGNWRFVARNHPGMHIAQQDSEEAVRHCCQNAGTWL